MRKHLWYICLLLFSGSINCFAQRYSFIEYSTAEGLPQSQVSSIVQDDEGYLWVGSFGGVARFNGKRFKNFGRNQGLLSNAVNSLSIIDRDLYIGHDIGISIKTKADTFQTVKFPNSAAVANTTEICEFQGAIYVSTNGLGLFKMDDNQLVAVENSPERIRFMKSTPSGELLLATRNGVVVFNGSTFSPHTIFPEGTYSDVHIKNDKIYASTYDGYLYVIENGELQILYDDPEFPIRKIYIDHKENSWINSRFGVKKLGASTIVIDEEAGLPMNDVTIIFQDRESNIWLGSGGRGLLKFCGETFLHYNKANGLPSELIVSIIEDVNRNLWLSSYDKGVFKIAMGNNNAGIINVPEIKSIVWSSAKQGNKLFFGSLFGLYIVENGNWSRLKKIDGLPGERITGIKVFGDKVYIGTSDGIAIYQDEHVVPILKEENQILNARDFTLFNDKLYVGAKAGLYEIVSDEIVRVVDFDGGINTVVRDDKENIWVGTENGVYTNKNGDFELLPLDNLSNTDYINFLIAVDQSVFIGTNNGLFEYDLNEDNMYFYGISSGLVDLETNLNSAYVDEDDNLWFGTVAGLMKMILSKRKDLRNEIKPLLNITAISINFEDVNPHAFLERSARFPYNQNNFLFELDGIYLSNPKQISYRYFLDGFSEDWSPLSLSNSINFTNLNHGKYTLKVQAAIMGGVFSDTLELEFVITPPFYQTFWFYGLVILLIVSLVVLIDRLRTQRIKRKNYQLNLEVKTKLIELEQQSLNASMNRHFIFNALNSIQYYINSADTKSANRYLTRFAKLIRKNLDSSHSKNGMVSLSDELERLELYLDIESMRFRDKFDYEITIDKKVEPGALKVPAMFLQPFVENSIIHGILPLKDRKGKITITISDHLDHIRIDVFDNGVGIDNSLKSKKDSEGDHISKGVSITKGRIELLQKVSARSIELIGPIQINKNDSSIKGTKVVFKILKQYLENE
jgi:ligand-binding sensor domain-containing protein